MSMKPMITRRTLLGTGAAAATMTLATPGLLRASTFPERNFNVYIPTAEGGGADRNFRAFSSVWKTRLGVEFEPSFYPGASGRVGYEIYMGKAEPDAYNLLFGNIGPEVLNWAMQAPSFDINDYIYFGQVDKDPCCLFVGAESPLQTMDDIIAAAKTRKLNVGTSRMAHPASIGLLALGDKLGLDFNLIPLQGGKGTVAGAVTGEVDFSVLTSGSVIAAGDSVKTLLVFGDNIVGEALDNLSRRVGFRIAPGLSERVIYRELSPMALSLLDLHEAGSSVAFTMSHVAARQEIRDLLIVLKLPGLEGREIAF